MNKEEKQREFLNNLVEQASITLYSGVRSLKSMSLPFEEFEQNLEKCISVFQNENVPSKQDLKDAMDLYDTTVSMMMEFWTDGFLDMGKITLQDEYLDFDAYTLKRSELYSKAMQYRDKKVEKHGVGFDNVKTMKG